MAGAGGKEAAVYFLVLHGGERSKTNMNVLTFMQYTPTTNKTARGC